MANKQVTRIHLGTGEHWVGDGFPVNTMFSYHKQGKDISPFLLLDYAGPAKFKPADKPRGVDQHPHRGFETVTIVYQGEVAHQDNAGHKDKVGPGDVQWMTAGGGILHEERHSQAFTEAGGTLEMVQLWVNLPAEHKMHKPRYQAILNKDIPVINLPEKAGGLRLIAGEFDGQTGPAKTFTPVNLWDMRLQAGGVTQLAIPAGHNTSLLVLSGAVTIGDEVINAKELAQLSQEGDTLMLEARKESVVLLMSGEPIDEPIAGHGPFVMNTEDEIKQAKADYREGRF